MTRYAIASMAILLAACGGNAEPEARDQPDTAVKAFMADVVQPQAEVFWNSAGAIIDETGEHDLAPTTDEGWAETRQAAAGIVESAELLMTPAYAEGRGDDWMQFSRSLVEVGKQAEQAAAAQDDEKVFEIGGTMYNVCTACHQVYLPENISLADFGSDR